MNPEAQSIRHLVAKTANVSPEAVSDSTKLGQVFQFEQTGLDAPIEQLANDLAMKMKADCNCYQEDVLNHFRGILDRGNFAELEVGHIAQIYRQVLSDYGQADMRALNQSSTL